ncbi:hypothetical protein AGABI1DRAFT_129264 [Agaricus bisporus var. burnettii JB137-S8]|uniref:Nephrocystin 3-like N-terminal domain-containing protein n=1 Tax=Agaricus bisporus var. burnettii (strain JB137-S8 / ATCC MYA-4627 / FGSC 10392) TaxID=597362 RepID=K5VWZ7_AGABU|nr:uncharacterized protein AGABI1DRAFT_129264 [Agaricus bisporus var. burnettii JB137-S8]EKM78999.1 hypothetical protein AGABI1DRAFT_129264 [Agaricus bisporus var. burnettii JB137-S8]
MTLRRKLDEFKAWLHDIFSSENGIQDGLQRHAGPGGFFNNAQHSAVHNSTMTAVQGNQYNTVTYSEGNRHIVAQMMGLLSQHITRGAAHDSSARKPPPRCHPETRVKLIARITAWFEGQTSLELLLWITGPASVGKSAIVQTFAEYLVKSHFLGASVFISRPNKRDSPHGVFITIAYQLATRIEAYRDYVFTTFIVEPFTVKKLGAGGKRWGILLDGLDELRGIDEQCEIIHLISSFAHEHPNAPLVWIIASRPESRISHTFEDEEVRRSYLVENIPIDTTEACADVERFLRSSLKTTQKNFRHCVSTDWPDNSDFLKLTAAASGLFIYAEVAMQFIRDPHHADPVARFEVLLSVINRSNTVPSQENPFVHLDALYNEILSSIPSTVWPTTKQVLGMAIMGRWFSWETVPDRGEISKPSEEPLKIPDWKVAHKKPLTFFHASFADYLKDSSRSRDFHVGDKEDVKDEVISRLLEIWNKCSGDDIATSSVEPVWHQYCSNLDTESPSRGLDGFYAHLFHNTENSPGSHHTGLLRKVHLKDLEFGHLDWKEMSPTYAHLGTKGKYYLRSWLVLSVRPDSSAELKTFVSDLESLQECSPEHEVFIVGGVPKERVAIFRRILTTNMMFYVVPHPE